MPLGLAPVIGSDMTGEVSVKQAEGVQRHRRELAAAYFLMRRGLKDASNRTAFSLKFRLKSC